MRWSVRVATASSDRGPDEPAAPADSSTTQDLLDADTDRQHAVGVRGAWARRAAIAALAAFVAAGLLGVFGDRDGTAQVGHAEYDVRLRYSEVSRGGLPAHWILEVDRRDGQPIEGTVEVETSADYLAHFDRNYVDPEPDATWHTADGNVRWEFEPDGEASLRVMLDIRSQPNSRWDADATTTVNVAGNVIAEFDYTTRFMP